MPNVWLLANTQSPDGEFYRIVFADCLLIDVLCRGLIVHEGYAIIRCLWRGNLRYNL